MVVKVQRKKIRRYKVGKRGIRDLKASVGRECCISRWGAVVPDCTMKVFKLKKADEEVTVLSPEEPETKQGGSSRSQSCQEF